MATRACVCLFVQERGVQAIDMRQIVSSVDSPSVEKRFNEIGVAPDALTHHRLHA